MRSKLSQLSPYVAELALLSLLFGMQLVFWQECQDPFNPVELAWAKVLLPLGVLPFFIARLPDFKIFFASWAARAVVAWIAWLWINAAMAPDGAAAAKNALEYSLYALLFFLPAILSASERRKALAVFLGACILSAIYGIGQHFNLDPWQWSTNFSGRPLGTIGNPDFFAGHLVMAWGACLGLLLCCAERRRIRYGILFGILSLVQLYSMTVGAWLGMTCSLAALWIWAIRPSGQSLRERWKIGRRKLVVAAAVILAAGSFAGFVSRGQWKASKAASVTNRLMMWKVAGKLWEEKPILGIGLTQYRRRFADVQSGILASEKGWNYVVTWLPHENFLYLLCETGLVGLLLFCLAWALATVRAFQRLKRLEGEAWAAALGTVGMFGVSLLNTFLNIPPSAMAFWLLLGLLCYPPRNSAVEARRSWLLALGTGALFAMVLGIFAGREIQAHRLIREGLREKKANQFQDSADLLQRAAGMGIKELTPQESVGVWYELGEVQRSGGALPQAVASYQNDLKENPNAPETHNMLGAALGQEGQTQASIAQLREAIRLSPGYSAAMLNLGIAYATSNDLSGAAEVWNALLKVDPDDEDAKKYLVTLEQMEHKKK